MPTVNRNPVRAMASRKSMTMVTHNSSAATVQAVMAALFFRERTGRGQTIEVPMFETMVAFNLAEHHGGAEQDALADEIERRGLDI